MDGCAPLFYGKPRLLPERSGRGGLSTQTKTCVIFFSSSSCGREGGGGGKRCSSRQNVVAVRGPESAAVSAAVRILPYGGEFPTQLPLVFLPGTAQ